MKKNYSPMAIYKTNIECSLPKKNIIKYAYIFFLFRYTLYISIPYSNGFLTNKIKLF